MCIRDRCVRVGFVFLGCFLVVCRVFVFCRMLDARGNLDLESPEELLTSSGTPGPRAPQSEWLFGASFLHHFSWCVFALFFHVFLMDSDLHFGVMLASFSMFFALLFRASILDGTVINFARICMCFLKYFCWFPWSYIQLAKALKTLVFTLLLHSLHFRKHMFFIVFETCFAAVCLHNLLLYFAPMLASFWYEFGIETWVFSIPIF